MGRRSGGGGRSITDFLRRRVESCKNRYTNLDGMVDYLCNNCPDYRRTKEKPFIRMVQQILDKINKNNSTPSPGKKNFRRRVDDNVEKRLQSLEKQHIKRRRRSDSSTGEEESLEEEEDGGVSTSEDAIYGEEVEPEFDLMKSMLREADSKSKSGKPKGEEKNVEFEVGGGKKLKLVNGDNRGGDVETRKESVQGSVGDIVEVKGKEGLRFRDLGGMGSVLEKLKMEVIVPSYHPQLPLPMRLVFLSIRFPLLKLSLEYLELGVDLEIGFLLYGPLGCGKTLFAKTVANEGGACFF